MFSVVVPTRNRPETLRATIQSCLAQEYEDCEFIVVDNASSSEQTREVVSSFSDTRLKFFEYRDSLAMTANWNRVLEHAQGRWVLFIGDDDGLCRGALQVLADVIDQGKIEAVRWAYATYTWPGAQADGSKLVVPLGHEVAIRNTTDRLQSMAAAAAPPIVPQAYHALLSADVVRRAKATGPVFDGPCPDLFSGVLAAQFYDQFAELQTPITIAGFSPKSNTIAVHSSSSENETRDDFLKLNSEAGLRPHELLPDLLELTCVTFWDAMLRVQDRMDPKVALVVDPQSFVQEALDSIHVSGVRRDAQIETALDYWAKAKGKSTYVPRIPEFDPERDHTALIGEVGIYEDKAVLECTEAGVTNVDEAAGLIAKVRELEPYLRSLFARVATIEDLYEAKVYLESKWHEEEARTAKQRARADRLESELAMLRDGKGRWFGRR